MLEPVQYKKEGGRNLSGSVAEGNQQTAFEQQKKNPLFNILPTMN